MAAAFAGGEPFPRDGMLLRFVTWVGAAGAHSATTRRTDWTDVHQFADTIATELAVAAATAERTEPHGIGHV